MDKVRGGDVAQLAHLFERHRVKLYNYYLRLTRNRWLSEDLVQEVFLRVLKYRHTFRGDGEFTMWMYHIARNVHRDYHAKWRHEQLSAGDQEEPAADDASAQDTLELDQSTRLLQEALARLPVEKRELLVLSRYQNLRYDVIAGILDCSTEAVKVRVHRAMNELRTIFLALSGEKTR
ncbi:RNA polymerase sigma factor [bacterium]|nr:MAG: RNA polymerase sigma factor [bacterium]